MSSNMRAAIVGTGRMGKAIVWAMDKLGCEKLTLIDTNLESLIDCSKVSNNKIIVKNDINNKLVISLHGKSTSKKFHLIDVIQRKSN